MPKLNEPRKARVMIDQEAARALHAEGKTDREIAVALGSKENSIWLWRKRNGLKLNPSPKMQKGYTRLDYGKVEALLQQGKTTLQISKETGISTSAINKWRRVHGCAAPRIGGANRKGERKKPVRRVSKTDVTPILQAVGRTEAGKALYMENSEIRFSFKNALNRREMLTALAELNLLSVPEMMDHLETLGFDMAEFRSAGRSV